MGAYIRRIQVQWGDCDPAGIVYFPRYFAFFDDCTAAMFEEAGVHKRDFGPRFGILGIPMVDVRSKFLIPSTYGDELDVHSMVSSFGRSSFRVSHKAYKDGELAVEAEEVRVWVARKAGTEFGIEAREIPQEIRDRLQPALAAGERK